MGARTILAGDIGGTKTALGWVDDGAITRSHTYPSNRYSSLGDIVREFAEVSANGRPHPALTDGVFLRGFVSKRRMRPLLESIPVHIIVSPTIALLGAAQAASQTQS